MSLPASTRSMHSIFPANIGVLQQFGNVNVQEAAQGDPIAAEKRLRELKDFIVLELNNEIKQLAQKYIKVINISKKTEIDALHLAFAVWYKVDYLLTWNCTHIRSYRVRPSVRL